MSVFRVIQGDYDNNCVEVMQKLLKSFLPEGVELEIVNSNMADEVLALASEKPFDLLMLYPGNNIFYPAHMFPQCETKEEQRLLFIRMMKEMFSVPVFNIPFSEGDPYVVNEIRDLSDFYNYGVFELKDLESAFNQHFTF